MSLKKWGFFCAGAALGSIVVKMLSDDDTKKNLAKATAAVLRATDDIMDDLYDIYDSALELNILKSYDENDDGLFDDDEHFDDELFDDDVDDGFIAVTPLRESNPSEKETVRINITSSDSQSTGEKSNDKPADKKPEEKKESDPELLWEDNLF